MEQKLRKILHVPRMVKGHTGILQNCQLTSAGEGDGKLEEAGPRLEQQNFWGYLL